MIHQMYIITSKDITPEAERTITECVFHFKEFVHFLEGEEVLEELSRIYE